MPENPTQSGSQEIPKTQQPGQFRPGMTMYHKEHGQRKVQDQAEYDRLRREGWTDQA
jgi:hypothetical protein